MNVATDCNAASLRHGNSLFLLKYLKPSEHKPDNSEKGDFRTYNLLNEDRFEQALSDCTWEVV